VASEAKTEEEEREANEVKRAEEKTKIVLRAKLAIKQAFERVDYKYDVINPEIKALKDDAAQGELPAYTTNLEDA
jgi:hypothetical protein